MGTPRVHPMYRVRSVHVHGVGGSGGSSSPVYVSPTLRTHKAVVPGNQAIARSCGASARAVVDMPMARSSRLGVRRWNRPCGTAIRCGNGLIVDGSADLFREAV